MKALSLTPPWPSAILHHGKRIENRERWSGCSYRGPILLHAAKGIGSITTFDTTVDALIQRGVPESFVLAEIASRGCRRGEVYPDVWFPLDKLQRGGIVGRARVDGVLRGERDFAAYASLVPGGAEQRRWWFGGFALVLADVEPIEFIPCKGARGLFDPTCAQCSEPATHVRRITSPLLVCAKHLDAFISMTGGGGWFEPLSRAA